MTVTEPSASAPGVGTDDPGSASDPPLWPPMATRPPIPPLPPVPPPPSALPAGAGHRPPRRAGRLRTALAAVVIAVVLLTSGFVLGGLRERPATTTAAPVVASATATTSAGSSAATGDEPVATAAAALAPSVVEISTGSAIGSGVIYARAPGSGNTDSSGLILTNAHVVDGARRVTVTLDDGTALTGTVVGSDTVSDIAVVSVDAPGLTLTVAPLATTDPVVGQTAIAIGSPFGLAETVTAGIVSAVDRTVETSTGQSVPMIQTDAPINPGNSGGALADRNGVVMGINTAIYTSSSSGSGDNAGIGFAIPITTARQIADQLVGAAH